MQFQQKLLDIIKSPYQLDDRTMSVLQKLTDDFPYCQTLQILMAKNLQEKDKLHFEAQVNKASAYAVDRRKFQRYISNRDKPQELVKTPEAIKENQDKQIIATVHTADQNLAETPANTVAIDTQSQPVKSSPMSLVEIVKRRLKEIQERDKTSREKGKVEEPAVPEVTPEQEKDIIVEQAHENGKEQIIGEVKIESAPEKHNPESIAPSVTVLEENSNTELSLPADQDSESMRDVKAADEEKTEIHTPEISEEEIKNVSENNIATSKPDNGFKDQARKQKKPDIHFLIDKFLKEEPRIQMRKDLPERQEDLSVASTNENPQLVSETLAVVFLKQGKKDKALDIYEKLCLKYPEKSSYFAKKILDINNEINI